jgi:hypothetical protein
MCALEVATSGRSLPGRSGRQSPHQLTRRRWPSPASAPAARVLLGEDALARGIRHDDATHSEHGQYAARSVSMRAFASPSRLASASPIFLSGTKASYAAAAPSSPSHMRGAAVAIYARRKKHAQTRSSTRPSDEAMESTCPLLQHKHQSRILI